MMGFVARGIAWFGFYLAIVLSPLGIALAVRLASGAPLLLSRGLGIATGILAFSLMTTEFGLVARIKSASRPFGTDALAYFHRWMGCAALAFVATHVVMLVTAGMPVASLNPLSDGTEIGLGAAAFWLTLLLVTVSLWRRRLRLRHEWWQATHTVLAISAVLASLGHALAVTLARDDRVLAAVLAAYAALFVALLLNYRLLRPLRLQRHPWELVQNRDEGASTRTLVLRPVEHRGLCFEPGQFAWLSTGTSSFGFSQHPISMSGSAGPPFISLEFSIKALGDWSAIEVPHLLPGARVYVDGPYGAFSPDRVPAQSFVLIAGGIGIAPMRSILLTLRDRGDRRSVLLIHAAHDPDRAVFREELASLARVMELVLVPVYEAPPPEWPGERGFVTAELLRRHLPEDTSHVQVFVCGPPAMMDQVEQALRRLGIKSSQMHSERFDLV
jgi:predicted ferric reductase